jgi:transposase, IS5 family
MKNSGMKVETAFVDNGYKGHGIDGCKIYISGKRRNITPRFKKQLKRRQDIEPHIGHMKNEGKLGLCRLKGIIDDQISAILCSASYT